MADRPFGEDFLKSEKQGGRALGRGVALALSGGFLYAALNTLPKVIHEF